MNAPQTQMVAGAQTSAEPRGASPDSTFAPWVSAIAMPIGVNGCGEDPRYGDRFALIKGEIDRLSGTNFEQVARLAREVLTEEGKDLRVAGYLILSTLYVEGPEGLLDAIEVYRGILDKYWDGCYPLKDTARIQSFDWLNSDRLETFLQQQNTERLNVATAQRLRDAVAGLNRVVRERMGNEAPQWSRISTWVEQLCNTKQEQISKHEQEQRAQDQRLRQASAEDAPLTDSRAEAMVAKLGAFYRGRGERSRAVALLRAYRWGGLQIPPHEKGVTRIPPLRPGAFTELAALQEKGAPERVFEYCESLLLEPGGQWNMDIQLAAYQSLVGLNDTPSAQLLEAEATGLVGRCGALLELRYEDGTPFATEPALQWLQVPTSEAPATPTIEGDGAVEAVVRRAQEAAKNNKGDLVAGLSILRELPAETGRQRFIKRLEEARLCVKTAQADMALPIMEALDEEIRGSALAQWEPALAIAAWRLYVQVIKQELEKADLQRKEELRTRMRRINAAVCTTDIQEAARMNRPAKAK